MYSAEQTKLGSAQEAVANLIVGMLMSIIITQAGDVAAPFIRAHIFSGFIWEVGFSTNIYMTLVFTITSSIRSYVIRRIFNNYRLGYEKQPSQKPYKKRSLSSLSKGMGK